jgi:hypothetical protein
MSKKRVAIAVLWGYSCWVIGGVAEFMIGTPAFLGLAAGVAGAVFFGFDPLGVVWPNGEQGADVGGRPVSPEPSVAVGDAPAR